MEFRQLTITWPHPDLPVMMATAAEIDGVMLEELTGLLEPEGFENVHRARRWVRARAPVRDVFEIMTMKGTSVAPRWGLSLDFVPHVKGDSVRSHATNKTAQFDITLDPHDTPGERFHLHTCHGAPGLRRDARGALPRAVRSALDWFASVDERHIVSFIEEHRRVLEASPRFKFDNYLQHPLALAFALARAGRTDIAHVALNEWARERCSAKTLARLISLLEKQRT